VSVNIHLIWVLYFLLLLVWQLEGAATL